MTIRLHHVTADDADRDRHRNPLDLTNAEIEQQRQRSIVQSQLQIDRLALSLTIRDNELIELRREVDALRAQIVRSARKQPRWWEWALAWLLCRAEALGDRIYRAWAHERW